MVRFFRVVEVTSNDEVIGSEFRLRKLPPKRSSII